jgi:hypothetical protein
MPLTNLNSAHLTEAEVTAAQNALTELENALAIITVQLTPEDRQKIRQHQRAEQTPGQQGERFPPKQPQPFRIGCRLGRVRQRFCKPPCFRESHQPPECTAHQTAGSQKSCTITTIIRQL